MTQILRKSPRLGMSLLASAGLLLAACGHHKAQTEFVKPPHTQTYDAAIEDFRAQHAQNPQDLNALLGLSRNLRYSGQGQAALNVLESEHSAFGTNPDFLTEYGKASLVAGKADQARDALTQSVAQGPSDWQTYSALGVAADLSHSHDQARDAYDHALKMCPGSASILNNKALSVAAGGDMDQAVNLMTHAFRLEPRSNRIATNLAALQTLRANCRGCTREKVQELARSIYPTDWIATGDGPSCELDHLLAADIVKELDEKHFVDLHVNFEFNSAKLLPAAKETLNELGHALTTEQFAQDRFKLEGHTDAVGTEDYNMRLSKRRADSVKAYLVDTLHLDARKLAVEGFGETRLLDPKNPTSGVNRRVRVVKIDEEAPPGPVSSR